MLFKLCKFSINQIKPQKILFVGNYQQFHDNRNKLLFLVIFYRFSFLTEVQIRL